MQRPLPVLDDRETKPFFDAAANGKLVYRACNSCDRGIHPPTKHCRWCGSMDTEWRESKGMGTLHTWTVVTQSIHPGFEAPYTIIVVELDEAPDVRLLGRLDGAPSLEPNAKMKVWFENIEGGGSLPQWQAADTAKLP